VLPRLSPRRWTGAAVALLAWLGTPALAQEDTILVEAAVQLHIENGPSEVVAALVYNGTMLFPVHRFLELSEVRVLAFDLRDSLVALLEPRGLVVHFHPDRGELRLGDTVVALGRGDATWWDGDLFASAAMLERAFGVLVRIEWADLSAFVGHTTALPVVRRARRERQRALVQRPRSPRGLDVRPPPSRAGGALLNWSLTGSTGARTDYYTLDLGLGAHLLGGGVTLRPQFWNIGGIAGAEVRASWERAWPEREWVRQIRLGDVQSNGRRAQIVRGVVVTNAPFIRSSEFDVEQVVGSLPPGWEVELYDRGRLLGYGEVDALGGFQVPLAVRYGQNPFELVLYGPTGEVMRQKRTVRVPFSRLPDGRFEYAAALGQCRYEPCDALVSADARYGLTSRVTVQGGLDLFVRDGGGALWQPYAVASGAVLRSLNLTGEAIVNGHLRAAVDFEPTPDLRVSLGHTDFTEAGREFSGAYLEAGRTEATAYWRPGAMNGTLYFQAFGVRSTQQLLTRTIARVSATARLGQLRYTLGLRHDGVQRDSLDAPDRFAVDLGADAVLSGRSRWARGTNVRGELSVAPGEGLAALAATIGRRIGRAIRADVGVGWIRAGGVGFTLALTTALPGPRVGLRSQANTVTGTNGLMFVNGSMVYDSDHPGVRWTDGGDLGRGGVAGVLFLDDNGNGVRDADEPGIPGIPVQVGGWYDETDAAGRFTAWDLFPFEAVEIVVDSLSFDDPRLVPAAPVLRVRPTPNSFLSIEVPVVVGAEISGWVALDGEALAGIPVVFRELNTGAELLSLTYSDGTFYRIGVPPGEYEITLPDAVAEALGVFALPLHVFVPPGAGDKRTENVAIELGRIGG
jgi:hypothetical protein